MALEVYINDERIELKANVGIGLTFQVGSVLNPSRRAGNLSNAFSVPKTKNNTRILGNLSNINSNTNIPYERNSGKIKQDGVEIISDGFVLVESIDKEYKVTIYSGNSSFFDLIKGKNVSDLDFGTHQFIMGTITASFGGGQDYIYPIIDYGNGVELLDNTDTQNINALLPALFVKSIFEKIVDAVGYTLKGSFIESDSYDRLLLTPNQFGYSKEVVDATSFIAYNLTTVDVDLDGALSPGITYNYPLDFTTSTRPIYDVATDEFIPDNTYIGNFEFVASGTFDGYEVPTNLRITIDILKDGVSILTETGLWTGVSGPDVWSLRINEFNYIVYKNAVYTAEVTAIVTTGSATLPTLNFTIDTGFFKYYALSDIRYTADVTLSDFYNLKQEDLIKDIINMYSLVIQTDDLKKEFSINSLNDLQDNIINANDWSGKIDLSKTPGVKFRFGSYGQENFMRYKEDDDVVGEFADSSFLVDDKNLEEAKDLVTLKSSAVNNSVRVVNHDTPTIPFSTYISETFDKKNSRLVLLDSQNFTVNFENTVNSDTSTISTNIPFCYFQKYNTSDSLDWTNLLSENYSTLIAMQDNFKMISASFLLKETDIANLDFTIPVFLDVHTPEININGYFYINKISNFKKGRSTKVDLIRL